MVKAKADEAHLARPFDRGLLRRAQSIADAYKLILEQDESGDYVGSALEMPLVMADGKTPNECVRQVRQALAAAVATLLESGQSPPAPASEGRRDQQVNIRLTLEEKRFLEEASRSRSFRGVSDFIRSSVLDQFRK